MAPGGDIALILKSANGTVISTLQGTSSSSVGDFESEIQAIAASIQNFGGWYWGNANSCEYAVAVQMSDFLVSNTDKEYGGSEYYTAYIWAKEEDVPLNKVLDDTGLKEVLKAVKSRFPVAVSLGKKDGSSGTQSIGTTITKLTIGAQTTVNTDKSGDYFEVTAGQIKCKKAGVVLINASVYLTRPNSAGYIGLYLYKNGAENMSATQYGGASASFTVNLSTIVQVSAGDYFDIRGRASASSTFYYNNRCTTLDIMYI